MYVMNYVSKSVYKVPKFFKVDLPSDYVDLESPQSPLLTASRCMTMA